jgi:hypothetical protein
VAELVAHVQRASSVCCFALLDRTPAGSPQEYQCQACGKPCDVHLSDLMTAEQSEGFDLARRHLRELNNG